MIKEFFVNEISELNNLTSDSPVVVGDEGCYAGAFNKKSQIIVARAIYKEHPIRYVTPILSEGYVEKVQKTLMSIAREKAIKVVFNDYGLLYSLRKYIDNGRIVPVLGRVLTKSIIDCPWYGNIISNENQEIRNALLGSTLHHESKINLLQNLGVNEVEVNCYVDCYLEELKQYGINIATYQDNRLISVGRSCYWAIWNEGDIKKCHFIPQCNKDIYIGLDTKWSKKKRMFIVADSNDKSLYNNIYVLGNKVYQKITNTSINNNIDFLIQNARFANRDNEQR